MHEATLTLDPAGSVPLHACMVLHRTPCMQRMHAAIQAIAPSAIVVGGMTAPPVYTAEGATWLLFRLPPGHI
jgi:hypothetical protein